MAIVVDFEFKGLGKSAKDAVIFADAMERAEKAQKSMKSAGSSSTNGSSPSGSASSGPAAGPMASQVKNLNNAAKYLNAQSNWNAAVLRQSQIAQRQAKAAASSNNPAIKKPPKVKQPSNRQLTPNGPLASYMSSVQKLNSAMRTGTATFDDYYKTAMAYQRLQRSNAQLNKIINGAQPKSSGQTIASSLNRLISSTRVGIGANGLEVMPLIGQTVSAVAELAAVSAPAAAGVAILGVALTGLVASVQAARMAAEYDVAFAQAQIAGGGSIGDTKASLGLGTVLGMSPSSMTGAAHGLNSWLTSNPYAGGIAQGSGFGANYVGPYGDTNDTARLTKAIDKMVNMSSDQAAQKFAMGGPLESMLWLRRVDPGIRQSAMDSANDAATPEKQTEAANATALFNIALERAKMLMIEFGERALPYLITGLDAGIVVLDEFTLGIMNLTDKVGLTHHTGEEYIGASNRLAKDMNRLNGDKSLLDSHRELKDSLDRNTASVNNNSRMLDGSAHTYGGGERAHSALPSRTWSPGGDSFTGRRAIHLGQLP